MSKRQRDTWLQANPPAPKPRKMFFVLMILMVLGLIELVGRIDYHFKYTPQENLLVEAFLGLGGTYDPNMVSNYSPHHYLIYTLNPNLQWNYKSYYGVEPKQLVNSLGYRGKETTVEKPEHVFRIVCLGGSTTFGLGESDESQTYPELLEKRLNELYPGGPHFEVINAGTPGWSSAESLINLHFRVLELSPDMVILYDGVNDTFAMRRPDEGKSDYSTFRNRLNYELPHDWERPLLRYSHFYRLLYIMSHPIASDINSLAVKPVPSGFDERKALDSATGKYFKRNVESIVAIAKMRHVTPVLVTMGHGPWHRSLGLTCQIMRDVARSQGAVLVDFEPYSRQGWFDIDNVHLLRPGNTALAEVIARALGTSGALRSQR
jgi:lysophospholipase L1-like esterase